MTYPPVIQFQTRALELEAEARLLRERATAGAAQRTSEQLRLDRLQQPQRSVMRLTPRACQP